MSLASMPFPSISKVGQPMNVDAMIAQLVKMTPEQRQQFAQEHMDDPISLSAAKYVDNQIKDQAQKMVQPQGPMPPVNQQAARSIGQVAPPTQPLMTLAPNPQQQPMQAQMQAQMQPQQTAIAQQASQNGEKGAASLPENSGIANLPSKMNFADGGIVGYAGGGTSEYDPSSIQQGIYKSYAAQQAQQYGLNPDFALGIFNQENSSWNPTLLGPVTKSGDRAIGLGQVMPNTGKGMGYSVNDLKDPYKNIDASVQTMAQISKKYNGDPAKVAAAYNWGPGNLDRHLANNNNQVNVDGLPKETKNYLANVLTKLAPGSTAHAADIISSQPAPSVAPAPSSAPAVNRAGRDVDTSNDMSYLESEAMSPAMQQRRLLSAPVGVSRVNSQASLGGNETTLNPGERIVNGMVVDRMGIPIRSATVSSGMSPAAPDTRSIFEKGADAIGISDDWQRFISNSLNALAGPELGAATYGFKAARGLPSLIKNAPAEVDAVAAAAAAKRARDLEAAGVTARNEMAASEALNAPTWAERANARAGVNVATGRGAGGIYELTQEAQTARNAAQNAARARAAAEEGTAGVQTGSNAARVADEAAAAAKGEKGIAALADAANAAKAASVANAAIKNVPSAASASPSPSSKAANADGSNGIDQRLEAGGPFNYGTGNAPQSTSKDALGIDQRPEAGGPFDYKDSTEQQGPPISAMNRDKGSSSDISTQPKKDASMLSSDDWLALAAGLLSNKSQYASEAFGAGLGSLVQGRASRKAAESQQALQAAQAKEAAGKGGYYDQLASTVGPETAAKIAYQESETTRLKLLNDAFPQKNEADLRQIDANIQRELKLADYINQQVQYYGKEATSKINLQDAAAALDVSRANMFEGKNDYQTLKEMVDALTPIARSTPDITNPESARIIMQAKNDLYYYSGELAKKGGIRPPDDAISGFTVRKKQ